MLPLVCLPEPPHPSEDPDEFLLSLSGPTAFSISGIDNTRTRGVVTLLHGNEPSGFLGLHRWLLTGAIPAVRTVCVIASVDAARFPPQYSHRMLPGDRDLNRCFRPPFEDAQGRLAEAIVSLLNQFSCEAVVDLHNNTGHNPPYGVITTDAPQWLALASYFADSCVHTDIRLGTLMEYFTEVPCVTIECGLAGSPAANDVAFLGLERYLQVEDLELSKVPAQRMQLYRDPLRVCVSPNKTVGFAEAPATEVDLTLSHRIDLLNFQHLSPGTTIGWLPDPYELPIQALNADGQDLAADYFENTAGQLRTKRDIVPIMMTTDQKVAMSDCLFYVVVEDKT